MIKVNLDDVIDTNCLVTVGNNRQLSYHAESGVFWGYLHGHNIFQYVPSERKVCFDTCGHMTTTTRKAMNEFIEFFKISARVSFAKKKFNVYASTFPNGSVEVENDGDAPITISLNEKRK